MAVIDPNVATAGQPELELGGGVRIPRPAYVDIIMRVVDGFWAGKYGPVNSPEARRAAIQDLAKDDRYAGASDRLATAEQEFIQMGGERASAAVGQQVAPTTSPTTPGPFGTPPDIDTAGPFGPAGTGAEVVAGAGANINAINLLNQTSRGGGSTQVAPKEAIFRRTQQLIAQGLSRAAALAQATKEAGGAGDLARLVTGGPLGTGVGPDRTGALGVMDDSAPVLNPFEEWLSESAQGRSAIGQEFLQRQFPTAGGPYQGYLGRQMAPLESQYLLQGGLGQFDPSTSFMDYMGSNFGGGGLDWRSGLTQAAGLVGGTPGTEQQNVFAEYLRDNPAQQLALAIQAGRGKVAAPFRKTFEDYARKQYDTFSYNNPLANWLPEWLRRGGQFS